MYIIIMFFKNHAFKRVGCDGSVALPLNPPDADPASIQDFYI